MIKISEWLPNPIGRDTDGEWIELLNDGEEEVSLEGWSIRNGKEAGDVIKDILIQPGEHLLLKKEDLNVLLRNQNETLTLYDATGQAVFRSSFIGAAPEGKSWSLKGSLSSWSDPTPGEMEEVLEETSLAQEYIIGEPVTPPPNLAHPIFLAVSVGLIMSGIVLRVLTKDADLKNIFFTRDSEAGR